DPQHVSVCWRSTHYKYFYDLLSTSFPYWSVHAVSFAAMRHLTLNVLTSAERHWVVSCAPRLERILAAFTLVQFLFEDRTMFKVLRVLSGPLQYSFEDFDF